MVILPNVERRISLSSLSCKKRSNQSIIRDCPPSDLSGVFIMSYASLKNLSKISHNRQHSIQGSCAMRRVGACAGPGRHHHGRSDYKLLDRRVLLAWQSMGERNKRILKYGLVGVLGTVVHWGTLIALVEGLRVDPMLSSTAGFILTLILSFYLNLRWTLCPLAIICCTPVGLSNEFRAGKSRQTLGIPCA